MASHSRSIEAQRRSSKNYDKKTVDRISVRVPKGTREKIKVYLERRHKEFPENPLYQSTNMYITGLIENESGIRIKGVMDEREYDNSIEQSSVFKPEDEQELFTIQEIQQAMMLLRVDPPEARSMYLHSRGWSDRLLPLVDHLTAYTTYLIE